MKCEHCREWLNQYIDYELSPEESGWVKEHISVCASCRQEYNALVRTKQASMSIPDYTPPLSFSDGWRAVVLSEMDAPQSTAQPQRQHDNVRPIPAAPPKRVSGLQRSVRAFALVAAALGVGVISWQAYRHFSALTPQNDIARQELQTADSATPGMEAAEGGAIDDFDILRSTDGSAGDLSRISEMPADTPLPEETAIINDFETDTANRGEETPLLPQNTDTIETPGALQPTDLGDSNEAQNAIEGLHEIFLSAPIDENAVRQGLEGDEIEYKYYEEAFIIIADSKNVKAINKVLSDLGSTETVVAGETVHIKFR